MKRQAAGDRLDLNVSSPKAEPRLRSAQDPCQAPEYPHRFRAGVS